MNEAFFISNKKRAKNSRQLKIELNLPDDVIQSFHQWESEDGNLPYSNNIPEEIDLPVRPGERFEVLDGHIIMEENKCFYMADLQKIR